MQKSAHFMCNALRLCNEKLTDKRFDECSQSLPNNTEFSSSYFDA